jgi:hypothetical protein
MFLQEGREAGRARISVVGKGAALGLRSPASLVPPLTVQLTNTDRRCWEAVYSVPARMNSSAFEAKADPTPEPHATRTPRPPRATSG